jgi:hypothetical protein
MPRLQERPGSAWCGRPFEVLFSVGGTHDLTHYARVETVLQVLPHARETERKGDAVPGEQGGRADPGKL